MALWQILMGALDNLLVSSELWQHRNDQGTATSITLIRALSALLPVSVPSPCLSCVSMPQSEKPPPFVTGSPSHGMPCNIHIKLNSWSCAWRRLQPASPDRRPRRQDVMAGLRSKIARVCESLPEFARVRGRAEDCPAVRLAVRGAGPGLKAVSSLRWLVTRRAAPSVDVVCPCVLPCVRGCSVVRVPPGDHHHFLLSQHSSLFLNKTWLRVVMEMLRVFYPCWSSTPEQRQHVDMA